MNFLELQEILKERKYRYLQILVAVVMVKINSERYETNSFYASHVNYSGKRLTDHENGLMLLLQVLTYRLNKSTLGNLY